MHDITIKGTHAHSFVSSFVSFDDLAGQTTLTDSTGVAREFVALAMKYRAETGLDTNLGELAAFVSYAQVQPSLSVFVSVSLSLSLCVSRCLVSVFECTHHGKLFILDSLNPLHLTLLFTTRVSTFTLSLRSILRSPCVSAALAHTPSLD